MVKYRLTTFIGGACAAAIVALAHGCGIDPRVWGNLTSSDFEAPPAAGVQTVTGVATLLGGGAQVAFYTPGGIALDQTATTDADGKFTAEFPATTSFLQTVVVAKAGAGEAWGLVPQVPAKKTVYEASLTIALGTDLPDADGNPVVVPFMEDLDVDATTATLLLLAKAHLSEPESTLASLSPEAVVSALEEIENMLGDADARLVPLRDMVGRLLAAGAATAPPLRPFPGIEESYLDATTLAATTDYSGDGTPDTTSELFDAALRTAIGALAFDVCYAPSTIRVVLITDFNEGKTDRNCSVINRFKWIPDPSNKTMFITGSLHQTTPNCATDAPPCVESADFDAASQLMGNWTPNIIPMYDDGTHGDAVAGDNLWTITFDLPYIDAGSPTARWVRISYKYTWGSSGSLWTGTEEWPGNQRILELRDLNGDHMIVRQDNFGDETTNKDKSNLLGPARGGCGTVLFQSELNPPPEGRRTNCVDDTLESQIDTNADCVLDAWPTIYSAAPITIPCEDK